MKAYSEILKLRTNDFDHSDTIKPSTLLDIFQDIAGVHAMQFGFGFKETVKKGYYWVLIRNYYEIFGKVEPLTDVRLETWPHKKGKVDFDREYVLYDSNDNVLVRGISKWILIDINTRRVARASSVSFAEEESEANYYPDVLKLEIPSLENFEKVFTYKVLKGDMDHNGHMNNSKYANIIYEVMDDINMKSFMIEYIHEVCKDDIIELYEYKENNIIYYAGLSNGKKIFTAKIEK